jgi:hypothetical protein
MFGSSRIRRSTKFTDLSVNPRARFAACSLPSLLAAVLLLLTATPASAGSKFYKPPNGVQPQLVSAASDGTVWMSGENYYDGHGTLWRFKPGSGYHRAALGSGLRITQLLPGPEGGVRFLARGDDGAVVGAATAGGAVTEVPISRSVPSAAEAADGSLWGLGFAMPHGRWLVRTAADGTQNEIPLPPAEGNVKRIDIDYGREVVMAAGDLWFVHPDGGSLVRATLSGQFRQFPLSAACPRHPPCMPRWLTANSDGSVTLTLRPAQGGSLASSRLLRISTAGKLTSVRLAKYGECFFPGPLAGGRNGSQWLSAWGNGCGVVGRKTATGKPTWLWRSRGHVADLSLAGSTLWAATDRGLQRFNTRKLPKTPPKPGGGGR